MKNKENYIHIFTTFLKSTCAFLILAGYNPLYSGPYDLSKSNYSFEHISSRQGLSQVSVLSMLQDHKGFLWFGTMDGLNRYDGYSFKVYRHHAFDHETLSNNRINAIAETSDSVMWVGTDDGLNRYSRKYNTFQRFVHTAGDSESICGNHIFALSSDTQGNLWVASDSGLSIVQKSGTHFHPKDKDRGSQFTGPMHILYHDNKNQFWAVSDKHIYQFDSNAHHLRTIAIPAGLEVTAIHHLQKNRYLAGTNKGLYLLLPQNGSIIPFNNHVAQKEIGRSTITTIFRDTRQSVWVATLKGIWICDKIFSRAVFVQNLPDNPSSLSPDYIRCMLQDNSGTIWLGTDGSGIDKFVHARNMFNKIQAKGGSNGLSQNFIYAIAEEPNGVLWVGSNLGLNRFLPGQSRVDAYRHQEGNPLSLSHNRVRAIAIDKYRNVWVGTYKGLNRFNRQRNRFEPVKLSAQGRALGNDFKVVALLADGEGNLWIGAEGVGLIRYQVRSKTVKLYSPQMGDEQGLNNKNVYCLMKDRDGLIWIGTYGGGINVLDPASDSFRQYMHVDGERQSLASNFIYALHQSYDGAIWVGTYGSGLDRLDPASSEIAHFDIEDGLPNNLIYGIESDQKNNLWLSTNRGLARFSPPYVNGKKSNLKPIVRVFNHFDGLPADEFNFGAHYKNKSGMLYFGSVGGLCYFQPDSLRDNVILPTVVITDFKLFNSPVAVKKDGPLKQQICETKAIELSHTQNSISFEFAALHYKNPIQNNYAYKMEGIDRNWIQTSAARRFANYTNLPGGHYLFKVKASNSDRYWSNQVAQIAIHIIPPWWQTWWFRIGLILGILAIFILIHRLRTTTIKKRNEVLNQMNTLLRNEIRSREESEKIREILFNIAQANTSALNQREFYLLIQKELNKLLDATNLFIGIYDKRNDALELPFMQDEKGDFIERVPIANTASALLIEQKKSMLLTSADIEKLQQAGQIKVLGSKPVSWLGVPLLVNEEAFGVLVIQSYDVKNIYTQKDLQLLEFVSNQLAVSIQKKQAEEEIRLLSQSIHQSPTSIIITDKKGMFEYANPRYLEDSRITLDEIQTQSLDQILRFEKPAERKRIRELIDLEGEWSGELKTKSVDGKTSWELVSIAAVKNDHNEISNYVIFREDITQIKELQLQLNQAQKMDSIGTLAGGIAHDFNNMLTVINGHAEIAVLKAKNGKSVIKDIESIYKAGKRAEALTSELLAFSRKQIYNAKVLDINHALRDFEQMLRRLIGEDIELKMLVAESPLYIKADKGQLEQVVMNLVVNARDAIQDPRNPNRKKLITVETEARYLKNPINISSQIIESGNYIQITISDSGIGMDEETIEKIFEPFFTTKEVGKGTGLGMATVYGIIKQNQGHVHVYSEPDTGTTIKVFWPVADAEEGNESQRTEKRQVREGFETILLVEDEESVREFAAEALRNFGYTVLEAENGMRAIEILREKHQNISLVISDIVMPEMSGTELIEYIDARFAKIQVLLVSGYSDNHLHQNGAMDGRFAFIQKPYSVETLLTTVSEILGY